MGEKQSGVLTRDAQKNRIFWIDVLRYIGMFCIYLGHFQAAAGKSYAFVFNFHVPLFFFLSGCTETLNRETSILKNIWKRVKTILIPFYVFALLSIVVRVLIDNAGIRSALDDLILVAQGCVRNEFFAAPLWFLTALFCVSILFSVLKKIKYKVVILLISLLANLAVYSLQNLPQFAEWSQPVTWWYNLGFALEYLIYYAVGYVVFQPLNRWLSGKKTVCQVTVPIVGILTGGFAVLVYFEHNPLLLLLHVSWFRPFITLIKAFLLILFFAIVAHYLENVRLFQKIGRNSLYLCGSEYLVKRSVLYFSQIFGLTVLYVNPFSMYLYTFCLLWLADKLFMPFEKYLIEVVYGIFGISSNRKKTKTLPEQTEN